MWKYYILNSFAVLCSLIVDSVAMITPADISMSASSPRLTYHRSTLNWTTASGYCGNQNAKLPEYSQVDTADISGLKKYMHMKAGLDVWTGDYRIFEVVDPQRAVSNSVRGGQCVAATLAGVRAQKDSQGYLYTFNLSLADCTTNNKYICTCRTETNVSSLRVLSSASADWQNARASCRSQANSQSSTCSLWSPDWSAYATAVDGCIGVGSILLGGEERSLKLLTMYWTNLQVRESNSSGSVFGHLLTCGYITYNQSRVMYAPCDRRKGFVCQYDADYNVKSDRATEQLANTGATSLSAGAVAGIVVSGLLVMVVGAGACIVWRKKQHLKIETMMRRRKATDSRPQGGRSFKPGPTGAETNTLHHNIQGDQKRITTYAQIDPYDLETGTKDTGCDRPYTAVQLNRSTNRPDIIPTSTLPGYLSMNGRQTDSPDSTKPEEGDYDSLCHSVRRNAEFEESTNVYGIESGEMDSSIYNSTSQLESSVQPAREQYDHVTLTETGTMHDRKCNSEVTVANNALEISAHNPEYEAMEYQR